MQQWNNNAVAFKLDTVEGVMVWIGGDWIAWSECSEGTKAVKRGLVRKNAARMPDEIYYVIFGPPSAKA